MDEKTEVIVVGERKGKPRTAGEWIEWKGGECPVSDDVLVQVRIESVCGNGYGESDVHPGMPKASEWRWAHEEHYNIIAYRICEPAETRQHVSTAAWESAKDNAGWYRGDSELWHAERGLMLVTVDEWDCRPITTLIEAHAEQRRLAAELVAANARIAEMRAEQDTLLAEIKRLNERFDRLKPPFPGPTVSRSRALLLTHGQLDPRFGRSV